MAIFDDSKPVSLLIITVITIKPKETIVEAFLVQIITRLNLSSLIANIRNYIYNLR